MFAAWPRAVWCAVVVVLASASARELDREIVLTPHAGESPEDRAIARWQSVAAGPSAGAEAFEQLGWAWVAKARRTHDAGYYKLAEKTADVADAQFGSTSGSQLLRGHVWHQLHRFAAAEEIARGLVARRGAPADWALLADVLVEQGKLAEATNALERLVALKPGPEAFSRTAHLRGLTGDLEGAIAAMEMACRASHPRAGEAHAWMLVRLAGLVLQNDEAARALRLADQALRTTADYAPALLARGRALLALERTADAIPALQRAVELHPTPEYQWWCADALRRAGRIEAAAALEAELKRRGEIVDPRTLALFLATRGEEPERALRLARAEQRVRRDPLTLDAIAWAAAANGDWPAAAEAMRAALAAGTADPRLHLHAAIIARKCGEPELAREQASRAQRQRLALTPSERHALAATLCSQPKPSS